MDQSWTPPPCSHRGRKEWRPKLGRVVADLVGALAASGEPIGAIPAKVILATREALSDRPSHMLVGVLAETVVEEGAISEAAFPGIVRDELDEIDWPWHTPFGAESVMAVVQHALGDLLRGLVPPYWAGCLEVAARALAVKEFWADDPRDPVARDVLLGRVMGLAAGSLGVAVGEGGPIGPDGSGPVPGLFNHLIRSLDRTDPRVVQAAWCIITIAAGDELRREVPGEPAGRTD